jgi:Domain of unknown function (DUF4193)
MPRGVAAPTIEERSLEQLVRRQERRQAREEDDAERDLAELIRDFTDLAGPSGALDAEDLVREDEFACIRCHMVVHRSRRALRGAPVCLDCAGALRRPWPRSAARREAHGSGARGIRRAG